MPVAKRESQPVSAVNLTPVQQVGNIWLKRDDLWQGQAPAKGGKSRTAAIICRRALEIGFRDICAAVDRNSSVPAMLSRVCKYYSVGLHIWLPAAKGELPPVFVEAKTNGATLYEISPGYMSVRRKRLRDHVKANEGRAVEIGIGLIWEDWGYSATAAQTANVQELFDAGKIDRVVVPVGSGGMLRGIIQGLPNVPILGVCCGNPPSIYLPPTVELVRAEKDFHSTVTASIGDVVLDPVYEAKCLPFLSDGDLLWIVAHRSTQ